MFVVQKISAAIERLETERFYVVRESVRDVSAWRQRVMSTRDVSAWRQRVTSTRDVSAWRQRVMSARDVNARHISASRQRVTTVRDVSAWRQRAWGQRVTSRADVTRVTSFELDYGLQGDRYSRTTRHKRCTTKDVVIQSMNDDKVDLVVQPVRCGRS